MKMTLHIDDSLLEKAMSLAGVESKTAAVDLALREFVRRSELVRVLSSGLKMTPAELRELFDPNYDLEAERSKGTPVTYGGKSRSRR
jgi:Arc/MetJ family transcription regulator